MKCSFCGNDITDGTGTTLIKKTGKLLHFCSSKCDKNMLKLKRNPTKTRWTKIKAQ